MSPVGFSIALALAAAVFMSTLVRRFRLLAAAQPAARFDRMGERVRTMLVYGLGQRKFLRGEQPAGLMHALIFWGFVLLSFTVVTLFGRAWNDMWDIPGFAPGQPLGDAYLLARDVMEVVVLAAVGLALYRRLIAHTPRLFGFRPAENRLAGSPHWEGILILCFIGLIMLGGLFNEAGRLVQHAGSEIEAGRDWAPVSNLLSHLIPDGAAGTVTDVAWWTHNLVVLVFLNLLPLSKHFHIITALPNVFFGQLPPRGTARPLAIDHDPPAAIARLNVVKLDGRAQKAKAADLTWKQVLDTFSCTECGRCSSACPATAAGTPLAPRQLILDLRDHLYAHPREMTNGNAEPIVGDRVIPDAVLWSCTTCMACVEACPVGIEHVPTIVDMRRTLVEEGRIEPMLQQALQGFATQGNSFGKSARMRARWTKALDFPIPDARKEPVEYLWFVGDFASFDERVQRASQRVARILHDAGVSFGMLYDGERNAGNDVRRVGEEGLFEMLVEQNMAAFGKAQFEAIFTTDPHSLNTLRNEYPDFGLDVPVYHYTELLAHLVAEGTIALRTPLTGTRVTYHDPCYLARYNRITDAPRKLIEATGAELVEMPRNGTNTFCCGAGGGRIWMDDSGQTERPSEQRIREALALGDLDYFIVSCPKDLAMYSDAAKTVGADIEVAELTALLDSALAQAEPVAVEVPA